MQEQRLKNITRTLLHLWAIANLLLACLILFDAFTELGIFLPWVFNGPKYSELLLGNKMRAAINLLVAIIASIVIFAASQKKLSALKKAQVYTIIFVAACGMLLGLSIFYTNACCDTRWFYNLGFPFAWLDGPVIDGTEASYLLQNAFRIRWQVTPLHIITSLNFWLTAGFILVTLIGKRSHIAQTGCRAEEM